MSVVVALWAAVAFAQAAKPTLVVVPLELDPNPALARFDAQLKALELGLLEERSGALVISKKETEVALKETKRQDFRESDEAIAKLATKAGSLYGVYTSLEYTPKKVLVLSGRVVRDDGKLMKSAQVSLPKGADTIVDVVRPLTLQLIAQLGLATLPNFKEAAPVVTPVEPVVVTPPVEPPARVEPVPVAAPVVEVDRGATQRGVGRGVLIAGAGVAVVGAVLLGVSGGLGSSLRVTPDGNLPSGNVSSYRTGNTLSTVGFATLGVGAAAAVVGAIVWGVAPSAPAAIKTVVVPSNGGAVLSFQGEF